MNSKKTRRDFLKTAAGATAGIAAASAFGGVGPLAKLAMAGEMGAATKDRYYIIVYFSGGWDILLGLDPRDPAVFTNGNLNTTRIQPGYEMLNPNPVPTTRTPFNGGPLRPTKSGIVFGPHIGDLAVHHDKVCVVRGMSMETLGHDSGRRRFLTGKPPSGIQARGSSASSWLASQLGAANPIPNLSVRVEAFNVDLPGYATALKVNSVPDLLKALKPGDPPLTPELEKQLATFLSGAAKCPVPQRSKQWQLAENFRARARQITQSGYDTVFDFTAKTPEMEKLRSHYGFTTNVTVPEAQAAMAARAIMSGVSRVASFSAAGGLDTHYNDWQTAQPERQERGFNTVARLIEDLQSTEYKGTGSTWLDHTTIIGFSEFSRTAMLNIRGGRDHSLTNACFLAGGGVKGGTVVGASSDVALTPAAVDLTSGKPDPGGDIPRPEHVWQALFEEIGITTGPDLRVKPLLAAFK